MSTERAEGYYWIKVVDTWKIGWYDPDSFEWLFDGDGVFEDALSEINETRIEPPTN